MKGSLKLNAVRLRLVLLVGMLLTIILAGLVFQFAQKTLRSVADETAKTAGEASSSQTDLQRLQQMQRELKANEDIVARAADIVAESKSYQYQNQIVNDLTRFASKADVSIKNIDFTPIAGSTTTPAAGAAPTVKPAAGLKAMTATITLDSPVNYTAFLRFVNDIEQNLTKMQLAKLSLTAGNEGLTSDALSIQVYVR